MGFIRNTRQLQCSFCGKRDEAVKKLIAGPQVFICNECINVCLEILVDDARTTGNAVHQALPCLKGVETQLLNTEYFCHSTEHTKHTH